MQKNLPFEAPQKQRHLYNGKKKPKIKFENKS